MTKIFIVSQSDGGIYQFELPVKLSYQPGAGGSGSANKDKVRTRRSAAGSSDGLRRVNVSPPLSVD